MDNRGQGSGGLRKQVILRTSFMDDPLVLHKDGGHHYKTAFYKNSLGCSIKDETWFLIRRLHSGGGGAPTKIDRRAAFDTTVLGRFQISLSPGS